MAIRAVSISAVCLIALGAFLYQYVIRDILVVSLGVGREIRPLSDFPYQCRRMRGPGLEACEDMWLSEESRVLYLACSSSLSRKEWMPNINRLNVSGRPSDDRILAMKIDEPEGTGFRYKHLKIPEAYTGVNNDRRLHVVGITGIAHEDRDELYIVNAKPSIDLANGQLLDQVKMGGNSTIEQFAVGINEDMRLIKTWSDTRIATPNNIAPLGDGSFYFTNDHGPHKAGIRHKLSDALRSGDVSFCRPGWGCKVVSSGHAFPNGLALGHDGLLYVPSAALGSIQVYRPSQDGSVIKIGDVNVPMPLDNISPDAKGDLYVAGIPKVQKMMAGFDDPLNVFPPATIWRLHAKRDGTYEVAKALEDRDAEALPGATTAVHDKRTGRLFISGVYSAFVTVCEPKLLDGSTDHKNEVVEVHEL